MPTNKNALPVVSGTEQGFSNGCHNITTVRQKSKLSAADLAYFDNTLSRYMMLSAGQNEFRRRFPGLFGARFSKCHAVAIGDLVSIMRSPEARRAYYSQVETCGNAVCCPVCAPRIMGFRAGEIRQAVHSWLGQGTENTCYMLTLTFSHSRTDALADMIAHLKTALLRFWGERQLKKQINMSWCVGRITSTEITYGANGWHPHQHILLFCRKTSFDFASLRRLWLASLQSSGLHGLSDIALDLIEARSVDAYLTKIGLEMALGNVKQGRGSSSFSPMQLLLEFASSGASWAADRFFELFFAVRGLHSLCWSRGLKGYFGINDVADLSIAAGSVQHDLERFVTFAGAGYRSLSPALRAMLRNYAAVNDRAQVLALLADCGIAEVPI